MSFKEKLAIFSSCLEKNMLLEKVKSQPSMKVAVNAASPQNHEPAAPRGSVAEPFVKNAREVKTTDPPQVKTVAVKKTSASTAAAGPLKALLDGGQFDISRFYVDRSKYKKLKLINSCSFGKVLVCECVDTGEHLAMKKLRGNPSDDEARLQYEREIAILGTVRHLAILSLCVAVPRILTGGRTH